MAVVCFTVGLLAIAGSTFVICNAYPLSTLYLSTRVTLLLAASGITAFGIVLVAVSAALLATVS